MDPRAQARAAGPSGNEPANPGPPPLTSPPAEHWAGNGVGLEEVAGRIRQELEVTIAAACGHEAERTREWFERAGLPKAARVAQREAYNVLRAHGLIGKSAGDPGRAAPAGGTCERGEVESPESREETIRLCVAVASEVHGIGLEEFLGEYVARGEMVEGEARELLREAREMGLWGGGGLPPR